MISSSVKVIRACAKSMDSLGRMIESFPHVDKLQPTLRAVELGGKFPVIKGAFVAPTATVIGKVQIGSSSSIWYAAVIRGDVNSITIGDSVTIGDRAMIHCTSAHATKIGNRVVVGPGAICHGCTLEDESIVGAGAQVMDGATVQSHGMVAPGALVTSGKIVLSGQLWSGIPAIYERDLSKEEITNILVIGEENAEVAVLHAQETAKSWQVIDDEEYKFGQIDGRNPDYYKRLTDEQWAYKMGELENHDIPGRVLDSRDIPRDWTRQLEGSRLWNLVMATVRIKGTYREEKNQKAECSKYPHLVDRIKPVNL